MTSPQDDPTPAQPTTPISPRKRSATVGAGAQNGSHKSPVLGTRKEPTLLTDFFLGRPSPQRLAAQRARLREAQVLQQQMRAEMMKEMNENSMRTVPPPNGVSARVKAWQKRNADVLLVTGGDPEIAPSEPSEIVINIDEESVTEEDRMRIKFRKASKREPSRPRKESIPSEAEKENQVERGDKERRESHGNRPCPENIPKKTKATPKKRIVSDDHWMKKKRKSKSPPRMTGARKPFSGVAVENPKASVTTSIPKDFLAKNAQNPTVSRKIHDWAMRVEPPDDNARRQVHKARRSRKVDDVDSIARSAEEEADDTRSQKTEATEKTWKTSHTVERADDTSDRNITENDGIRVLPLKTPMNWEDDGIRVRPLRLKRHDNDNISATPTASAADPEIVYKSDKKKDGGIRITPSEPDKESPPKLGKNLEDDGIRIIPSEPDEKNTKFSDEPADSPSQAYSKDGIVSNTLDDGIRVRPIRGRRGHDDEDSPRARGLQEAKKTLKRNQSQSASSEKSRTPSTRRPSSARKPACVTGDKQVNTDNHGSTKIMPSYCNNDERPGRKASQHAERRRSSRYERKAADNTSEDQPIRSNSPAPMPPPSEVPSIPSTQLPENLNEIPFGQSAFSELDLPTRGRPQTVSRPKMEAQRTNSFKAAVPRVFKKVVEESKKIIHDTVEVPKPATNQPPSIERWLDTTVDPFVAKSSDGPDHHRTEVQREWVEESQARRRSSSESRKREEEIDTPARKRSVSEHRRLHPQKKREDQGENDAPARKRSVSEHRRPDPRPKRRPTTYHPRQNSKDGFSHKQRTSLHASLSSTPVKCVSVAKPNDRPPRTDPKPRLHSHQKSHEDTSRPEPVAVQSEMSSDLSKSTESTEWTTSTESTEETQRKVEDKEPRKELLRDGLKSSPSSAPRRSQATRTTSASLPMKVAVKKPWKEALKEAFRGESVTKNHIPLSYPSQEVRQYEILLDDEYSDVTENTELTKSTDFRPDVHGPHNAQHHSGSQYGRNREAREELDECRDDDEPELPERKPPTAGFHQLSTIMSEAEESQLPVASTISSSYLSETTVTQTTSSTVTASTAQTDSTIQTDSTARTDSTSHSTATESTMIRSNGVMRKKSEKSSGGLKRRLTKHSDLVSVLSLPEDPSVLPSRSKSLRSAPNVHRSTSKLGKVTLRTLLREFREDENLYLRELKTLVDGVIPVLLGHVVQGKSSGDTELFGDDVTGQRATVMSKAVVAMGVSLEKIRNAHLQAPLIDPRALAFWLNSVEPLYSAYLDVWKLGFQDLVVNLAPAAGVPDDEDSLINAMPRNEQGDVVNDDGERVDVAHLLKRPLHRIKSMERFVKGCYTHIGAELEGVLSKYDALYNKARQRHKEETARMTDEEACCTDASRVRSLRTLGILGDAAIDQTRKVNAKDIFTLDFQHSNGQRLTCQIEIVFRDNPRVSTDRGDLLFRETGHKKNWLLFEPIPVYFASARRGDAKHELVAMVRGTYKDTDWFELLTLIAPCEDQVEDWLEILGTDPVPPSLDSIQQTRRNQYTPSSPRSADIPLGETSLVHGSTSKKPTIAALTPPIASVTSPKTPIRYHRRQQSSPAVSSTASSPDHASTWESSSQRRSSESESTPRPQSRGSDTSAISDSTVTQSCPIPDDREDHTSTVHDDDDTPPPPPAHKTFLSKKQANFSPPVEMAHTKLRRHGSSPLKHEYQPSNVSSEEEWEEDITSESSASSDGDETETETETEGITESEFETESDMSENEFESEDASIITPAISIKNSEPSKPKHVARESQLRSRIESEVGTNLGTDVTESSLAPEHSASQVGIPRYEEEQKPEYLVKTIATISYWSNRRAQWKEALSEQCSIIVTPGLVEAYPIRPSSKERKNENFDASRPLLALDLTPLVMIRQSTLIDLEIRSPARSYCQLNMLDAAIFRFRTSSPPDCASFYQAVHTSRMNNAKFKALEQEARFKSFGQQLRQAPGSHGDDTSSSSRRRSWFGRKNSYRASRTPSTIHSHSQSTSMSSGISATSFLRRLAGRGNLSFNLARSSIDRTGGGSIYTSSDQSPRSPSISYADSGRNRQFVPLGMDNLRIRCHLLVTPTKWEDYGNCRLQITRPPPGMKQELRAWHGLEKRIIVTTVPKKKSILTMETNRPGTSQSNNARKDAIDDSKDQPKIILDVVLGSGCFSRLGSRGICLNVWEEGRSEGSDLGRAPETGMPGGKVTKWCFQCVNVTEANWIYGLVAQEVLIAG